MSSSPARSPEYEFEWAPSTTASTVMSMDQPPPKIIDDLSPPLIAMLAVAGAALLIVVYARLLSRHLRRLRRRWSRWRRCRRLLRSSHSDFGSGSESVAHFSPPPPPFPFSSESDNLLSPYGLDDSAIKALPLSLFSRSKAKQPISTDRDCAVCLFEFDDGEWIRTLPICGHAFHIECIDVWLRSRPTCPLCRSAITFRSDSPFVPMRAGRIRPSFDDIALERPAAAARDPFMLKRSYSFGFERSVGADRMSMSGSPSWRVRMQGQSHQQRGFWSKRWASPFGGGRACYQRGGALKSPFGRRWGFVMFNGGVGSSAMGRGRGGLGFSSSRMRCGDPEALISPERFNRR